MNWRGVKKKNRTKSGEWKRRDRGVRVANGGDNWKPSPVCGHLYSQKEKKNSDAY